jgi:RNA polymerase sigma-32 factor
LIPFVERKVDLGDTDEIDAGFADTTKIQFRIIKFALWKAAGRAVDCCPQIAAPSYGRIAPRRSGRSRTSFHVQRLSCKDVDQHRFDLKSKLGKVAAVERIVGASCARLKANLISNAQFNSSAVVAGLSSPNVCLVETRCSCRQSTEVKRESAIMARTATLPALNAESSVAHYLEEIRQFPMLEPHEEYLLARNWRERADHEAAHRLVTSHLRLVAKIAMGYRGYGLPISEVVSEGNVGLMQAVKRFEPERGFRLATYAKWWIKATIQEYVLRSWSLVKMGTTANQKKLFFNLRKAKGKISALGEGDLRPDQVQLIAQRLGVDERDVVDMNRRLAGDASLNAPIREGGDSGAWMDWLVDEAPSQERILAEHEERENRLQALTGALDVLNERERRIFEARRLADDPLKLDDLASEFAISREWVRQIEGRAFEKVQKAVKNRIASTGHKAALEVRLGV